eukprot:356231-Chlamydomonas_euryale.AAC.2
MSCVTASTAPPRAGTLSDPNLVGGTLCLPEGLRMASPNIHTRLADEDKSLSVTVRPPRSVWAMTSHTTPSQLPCAAVPIFCKNQAKPRT